MPLREKYPALTGLRAAAMFLVYLHHFPVSFWVWQGWDWQKELHIGLPIFFVLSGFLITYRYYGQRSHLRIYFQNRFARVYPTFLLLFTLSLFLEPLSSHFALFLNYSFLKAFFGDFKFSGLSQSWSLTVEECFYAATPLLFWAVMRYGMRAAWVACVLLGLFAFGYSLTGGGAYGFLESPHFVALYTFFGRFPEFLIGMHLGLHLLGEKKLHEPRLLQKHYTWAGVLGLAACVLIYMKLNSPDLLYGVFHPVGVLVNNLVQPVFIALLLYGLIREDTWLRRTLGHPVVVVLGHSSYAFYLLHYGALQKFLWEEVFPHRIVNFCLLVSLSLAVYWLWDKPMNALLKAKKQAH